MATNTFAGSMCRTRFFLLAILLFCNTHYCLQAQDSARLISPNDSAQVKSPGLDSTVQQVPSDSVKKVIFVDLSRFPTGDTSLVYGKRVGPYIAKHPYYKTMNNALRMPALVRTPPDTDWIFYFFSACMIYLALIRMAFPKYFQDLFRVFLNSSLRQKQIREQLIQEPLPSLMLNIFFFFSGGLFLYFLAGHFGYTKGYAPLLALGFCILLLIVVYLVKYLVLQFMGWIFGKQPEAEIYTFIIFMVNKIAGLVLLPIAVILAFSGPRDYQPVIILGILLLLILLVYRLIRSYSAIYKSLRINQLHFLLFVFAFEAVPIMLLYKVLNNLF
jgi:MFS family permease